MTARFDGLESIIGRAQSSCLDAHTSFANTAAANVYKGNENDPHQRLGCHRGDTQKQALKQASQGPRAVTCYSIQDSRRRTQHPRSHLHHHEQGGDGPLRPRPSHARCLSLDDRPRLLLVMK
ncbi:hypothetical protein B0H14DRAFT_3174453 [Mycena olivaceomarginata]|nr:hypothetical protein B0H14DRAFT_3174453 [Mycena olivaceomarginata]